MLEVVANHDAWRLNIEQLPLQLSNGHEQDLKQEEDKEAVITCILKSFKFKYLSWKLNYRKI